jgi:hypothetical protein
MNGFRWSSSAQSEPIYLYLLHMAMTDLGGCALDSLTVGRLKLPSI